MEIPHCQPVPKGGFRLPEGNTPGRIRAAKVKIELEILAKRISMEARVPDNIPSLAADMGFYSQHSVRTHMFFLFELATVAATCLYSACMAEGRPDLAEMVPEAAGMNSRVLATYHRRLTRAIADEKWALPSSILDQTARELGVDVQSTESARSILRTVDHRSLLFISKNPKNVCSAALFIAQRDSPKARTYREFCAVANMSDKILRRHIDTIGEVAMPGLTLIRHRSVSSA